MTNDVEKFSERERQPEFEGSWEESNRNLNTAVILVFIIVFTIYANAQGFIGSIALALHGSAAGANQEAHKSFIEVLSARAMSRKGPIRLSVIISQFLFLLLPTIWFIRHWHTKNLLRYVRLRKIPFTEILMAFIGAILFFPVSAGISNFMMHQIHFPDFLARIDSLVFAANTPSELVWVIVVVCVTPAICEETLFRGYVQRTLERTIGAKSLFVAGILFGLYHMRPLNLISLSLFGMLIGYFAYRSKSLLPSMTAHFTYNLVAVLSVYKLAAGQPKLPFSQFHIPFILVFLAAAGTIVVVMIYRNLTGKNFPPP